MSFDKVRGFISDDIFLRGWELSQKNVGIVGFGKIGQEIAGLSKALGMTVTFYDNKVSQFTANYQPFEDLLRYSDVIVLADSKIRNAFPIIGKHEIALMKKEAYLINPSRSDLVDNAEVLKAIQNHQLNGYAVDDKIDLFLNASIEPGRILQTGCTAWYSTEAIARGTQNWNEEYFLFYEELDYTTRLKQQGYEIGWCQNSLVYHKGSASVGNATFGNRDKLRRANYYENLSTLKYTANFYRRWLPLVMVLRFILKSLALISRGDIYLLSPLFQAYKDFIKGL